MPSNFNIYCPLAFHCICFTHYSPHEVSTNDGSIPVRRILTYRQLSDVSDGWVTWEIYEFCFPEFTCDVINVSYLPRLLSKSSLFSVSITTQGIGVWSPNLIEGFLVETKKRESVWSVEGFRGKDNLVSESRFLIRY